MDLRTVEAAHRLVKAEMEQPQLVLQVHQVLEERRTELTEHLEILVVVAVIFPTSGKLEVLRPLVEAEVIAITEVTAGTAWPLSTRHLERLPRPPAERTHLMRLMTIGRSLRVGRGHLQRPHLRMATCSLHSSYGAIFYNSD